MFKEQRTDRILEIIRENKYVTVEQLVNRLHYSPATIRRDITYLANLGLVKKSYGGVSITNAKPFVIREHENITEKIKMCRFAQKMVNDGDTVFIDGTTTTYFLGEALLNKKNITVVTTNIKLATFLGEHKVNCIVCGGKIYDGIMLGGALTNEIINKMRFDIAFFAVGAVDSDGQFSVSENYWIFMLTAKARAKKSVLLNDKHKFNENLKLCVGDLSFFDSVICDGEFPKGLEKKFLDTDFIVAE